MKAEGRNMKLAAENATTESGVSVPQPSRRRRGLRRILLVLAGTAGLFVILLLGQAWSVHHRETKFREHVSERIARMEASRPALADGENAAILYEAAFRLYVAPSGEYGFDAQHGLDNPLLIKYLADNEPFMRAMERAVAIPRCRFPLAASEDLDRYQEIWDERCGPLIFITMVAPRHAAYSGNPAEALRLYELPLRTSRDIAQSALNGTMSMACTESAVSRSLSSLPVHGMPEDEFLAKVIQLLGHHVESRPNMVQAAQDFELQLLSSLPLSIPWSTILFKGEIEAQERFELACLKLSGTLVDMSWATEATLDARISILDKPHYLALDELGRLDEQDQAERRGREYALATTWAHKIAMIVSEDAGGLASVLAARLALGCRLYRLKFGAYPETLAGLSAKLPEHFKELPADPFTGKPFLYRRTESGCAVWSAGRDRADDGGDPKKDVIFELKK